MRQQAPAMDDERRESAPEQHRDACKDDQHAAHAVNARV
jgi:hypothetical protein